MRFKIPCAFVSARVSINTRVKSMACLPIWRLWSLFDQWVKSLAFSAASTELCAHESPPQLSQN